YKQRKNRRAGGRFHLSALGDARRHRAAQDRTRKCRRQIQERERSSLILSAADSTEHGIKAKNQKCRAHIPGNGAQCNTDHRYSRFFTGTLKTTVLTTPFRWNWTHTR